MEKQIRRLINPVQYVRLKHFENQSEFAAWLSRRTGRRIDQTTVSRWENWQQTPNGAVRRELEPYTGISENKILHIFKDEIKRRKKEDDYRRGNKNTQK